MDYKNNCFEKVKVNTKISNIFVGIIKDIPSSELCSNYRTLTVQKRNSLISYEDFYMIIYKCVLEYVPRKGENLILKIIKKLPTTIKNIQHIIDNKKIIEFQQYILDKYFYDKDSDNNIKKKINELKSNIEELIKLGEVEHLDIILDHFDDRMRTGLLTDLKKLSSLMNKVDKISD